MDFQEGYMLKKIMMFIVATNVVANRQNADRLCQYVVLIIQIFKLYKKLNLPVNGQF